MEIGELKYGRVKVIGGRHKGRIGIYDNDNDYNTKGIIYFGDMFNGVGYYEISYRFLDYASISDLIERREEISKTLMLKKNSLTSEKKADLLHELSIIDNALYDGIIKTRFTKGNKMSIFVSHSSKDKQFARWLATDLANIGHIPWLDEWKIKVGESIPVKISEGISSCDALLVVLSKNPVKSRWVENEWQAKYWDEINDGKIKVLPVLIEQCEIPVLLKTKKYADFTLEYNVGLEDLLFALKNND